MDKIKSIIKEYGLYVITIILVLLVKKFIVSPIKVNGTSMMTTLHDGDIMILNIIGYRFDEINRFDIVVVDEGNEYLIKRVIGLPGEEIEYKDNQLYINGKKVKENYGSQVTEDFKVKVKKNSYFVLGDNRTNSTDSRILGLIKEDKIKGKAVFTVLPINKFGRID